MKLFSLICNELEKQFKKPSIKVMVSLILISAIFLPIIISKFPASDDNYYNIENNKFLLKQAEEYENSLKNDKTQKGKILLEYAAIEKEYIQLLVDNKISYEDWKRIEADEYRTASYELASIEFVLEGYEQGVVLENIQNGNAEEVAKYYKLSLDKKKEIESALTAKKEKIKNIIVNNDYLGHTQEEIARKKQIIEDNKNLIAQYNELKAKNPKDEEGKAKLSKLENEVGNSEKLIQQCEEDIKILEFRLSNKIDYSTENWKNNSIKAIEKELQELRMPLLQEKDYSITAEQQGYSMSYDEYVKNYNETNNNRINKIKEIWYGLENNIPGLKDIKDARSILNSTYEVYVILAVILVIVVGGGIVASEFSKGTVRLLLIRPVSRWKVLLSKLLAIMIIGFMIVVGGIVILTISTGIVYGMDTYKTPLLETYNNAIIEVNFFKYLIPKIVISCTSLVFIASLVFMISTLSKNTALAVAISMVLYMGTAPGTDLLISMKQTWIVNTFIPYINASYLRLVPMAEEVLQRNFGMSMNYTSGAIQLIILSILMLAITFFVFIKKDVKN